jgi:hypothetical protein
MLNYDNPIADWTLQAKSNRTSNVSHLEMDVPIRTNLDNDVLQTQPLKFEHRTFHLRCLV